MSRHVFTYGSLMFDAVWSLVVAERYRSMAARLDGHVRHAIAGEDYPGMVARADQRVDGVMYLDVADVDLARLDRFEGDDYRRASLVVACADGVDREAETYVYLPVDRLLPTPWEPDAFALDRFIATYCRDRTGP